MKNLISLLVTFVMFLGFSIAQNDTMYIMKSGNIVGRYRTSEVDSVIFYQPSIPINFGNFTDSRDGNIYQTVSIGDQVWMAENLRYLPNVIGPGTGSQTAPYYYVYSYNGTDITAAKATSNYSTYGVLYNWTAAMNGASSSTANPSGIQGVCPLGWHLPSDAEWEEMENYLADNGYNYDSTLGGGRDKIAKSLATATGWSPSSNEGAVGNSDYAVYKNKSGFTGLPGGLRYEGGAFDVIGEKGYWWTAAEFDTEFARYRNLLFNYSFLWGNFDYKQHGYSVRCVKD